MPDRDLLAGSGPVEMGQRGDSRVQAPWPRGSDILSDRRRRAERNGHPGQSGQGMLSRGTALQARPRRQSERRTRGADRGRRARQQGWPQQREDQADRRHARRRLRCAGATRAAPASSPDGRGRLGIDRRNGRNDRPRRCGAAGPLRGRAAAHSRRDGGRDGPADDELHGGSVQGLGSGRGSRQYDHGARNTRQRRRAHRERAEHAACDSGDVDGDDRQRLYEPRSLRSGELIARGVTGKASQSLRSDKRGNRKRARQPRSGADAEGGLR